MSYYKEVFVVRYPGEDYEDHIYGADLKEALKNGA